MVKPQALIIDDNTKNLHVLARLLSSEGFNSIQVMNPTMLEDDLNQFRDVSIVFLDLEMPGTDGFQLLKRFKANPNFEAVPIVAYTVHVSEINVAHQVGFDGFLGKPLDSDRFPDQLERILAGKGVWETP